MKKLLITMKEIRKEKKEGTKTVYNTIEKITKNITQKQYENIISNDTKNFFKSLGGTERSYKNYTCKGYITTKIISTSPDKKHKTERLFNFELV